MTDTCITIDSSDEDDVQIMDPPVVQAKSEPSDEVKRKVPLQTVETGKSIFTALLSTCKNTDPSKEMDIIVNKMWKRFHGAESSYTSSAKFIEFVKTLITKASSEPFCQLKSISDDLKFHTIKVKTSAVEPVAQPGPSTSTSSNEPDRKTLRTIRKLEQLVSKLQRKIDRLEKEEVDLDNSDNEENSAYIQVCRYKTRICDVYKKICELRKTDTFDDVLLGNIKFSGTKISAVNRAIERFYNDKREFPDFRQVLTIVEKANELKNLQLLPHQCHETAVQAFKELGETLKRKRQFEFHDNLTSYLENNDCDPATVNQMLEEKLQENKKLYGNRIDEIIDKYAKKQIEDKLEPEDVPDDAASESAEEEEDEDDNVSVIVEVESVRDDSSADEDDATQNMTDDDVEPEEPFVAVDCRVVIPDVHQMPEWVALQKAERARRSTAAVCHPVAGCSKDVVDDYREPCANKTPSSSATKRSHAGSSDDSDDDDGSASSTKVAKVDPTAGSKSTKLPVRVAKSLAESFNMVNEDPLASVKTSRVPNGITDESTANSSSGSESPKQQSFVVVDVESILAKKPAKLSKLATSKTQNDAKIVDGPSSSKTESVVTPEDGVSVRDPGLKDHWETSCKNGIKIVNVSSKKDVGSTSATNDKNKVSTDRARDGSGDEIKHESNGSKEKKNCVVINLDEASRLEKTVADATADLIKNLSANPKNSANLFTRAVPNTNQYPKAPLFRSNSHQETNKPQNNLPPWQKFSPSCNRFPATSTPKAYINFQPRASSMPSSNRPNFTNASPRTHLGNQRHPHSQPPFGGSFGPNRNARGLPPGPRIMYNGPMAKQTMQTTQQFVKGNNVYTRTMTVVQEVQMKAPGMRNPFPCNGPVGRGVGSTANPTFGAHSASRGTSSSSNHRGGGAAQNPRQNAKRRNSADVITLE